MPTPMTRAAAPDAFYIHGVLTRRLDDVFEVETRRGVFRASQAAGCLLEPEPEDKVLLTVDPEGESYILTVLARAADRRAQIRVPGGLAIHTPDGFLEASSGRGIRLTAPDLEINADQGRAHVRKFHWAGEILTASLNKADLVVKMLETSAGVMVQKARESYRFIDGLEQACLGRLRCLVDGSLFMKSRRASVTAEEMVKIDGESIHLG